MNPTGTSRFCGWWHWNCDDLRGVIDTAGDAATVETGTYSDIYGTESNRGFLTLKAVQAEISGCNRSSISKYEGVPCCAHH